MFECVFVCILELLLLGGGGASMRGGGAWSVQNVGPPISTADATHMCMHYRYVNVGMGLCIAEAAAQIKAS